MSIPDQLAPEQWRALETAPWAVGAYVATAVGGKLQEVRELLAVGRVLRRALARDHDHDLVGAVAAAVLGAGHTPAGVGLATGDRAALLRAVADAGAAAGAHPQGHDFVRWLMELAREVAAAEADGGFLGLGAEAYHTAEQIALGELAEALGLLGA